MKSVMPEPKLCPFCGNRPTIRIFKGRDGWRDRYAVLCRYDDGGCGAESGLYHSQAEAVEAWNRRTDRNSQPDNTGDQIGQLTDSDLVFAIFKALMRTEAYGADNMTRAAYIAEAVAGNRGKEKEKETYE